MAALRKLALSPLWRVASTRLSPSVVNGEAVRVATGNRAFSTTNSVQFRRELMQVCDPLSYQPAIWNYEIQELTEKAKGSWKDFTPQEIKKMYAYYFFENVEDEIRGTGEFWRVLGLVMVCMGLSVYLYMASLMYITPGGERRKTLTYRWYFKQLEYETVGREMMIEGEYADYYKAMEPDLEKRREKVRAELQLEERFRKRVEERLAKIEAEKKK